MSRRPRRVFLVSIGLLLLATACTRPKVVVSNPEAPAPDPAQNAVTLTGIAYIAQPYVQYIFGPPELYTQEVQPPRVAIQPSTLRLTDFVPLSGRLKVTPLSSTPETVALGLQETASGEDRWGEVMIPAERNLFVRFAADTSLGDWLIIVNDVIVLDGPDPVPLTAYRWARSDVETYSACGIPLNTEIDGCTADFYHSSEAGYLIRGSRLQVGQ